MKNLLLFWREVQVELGTWCRVRTDKDWETVLARVEQEGDAFMTITLPDFGKDFERGLDQGQVTPDLFQGFKKREKLPLFLGNFMELLFDRSTGRLIDAGEGEIPPLAVEAVFAIRQLTLMFGKILRPCTPEREEKAMVAYIETERELKELWNSWPSLVSSDIETVGDRHCRARREFQNASRFLFRHVLTAMDNDLFIEGERNEPSDRETGEWRFKPKHGPGSTADRLSGNGKFDQYEWTQRLERVFPFGEVAIPSWRSYYLLDRVQFLAPEDERPVRVVLVPKTQKTPRVIAIEPTCMQYMQQAIAQRLVDLLESDTIVRGMIGFTDQMPNQLLASEGSLYGDLATLDLSEASDRVSWQLVREDLWYDGSPFMEAVDATRSRRADVPGHGVQHLTKFASMGSALTFPIEAMVFLTCVFVGIARVLDRPVTADLVNSLRGSVRVYGDDIIVPVRFAKATIEVLEALGFKVNRRKSFWTGKFRESCGAEFYAGSDVSITRVRRDFPQSRHDAAEVLSMVSLRNQLYWAGLWKSAKWLDEKIGEVLPHYPTVEPESPAVGRHSLLGYETESEDDRLHRPLVKGYVVKSIAPKSPISGEGALLKCLTHEGDPLAVEHLQRQGRPDAVRLKLRWVQPF